MDPDTKDTVWYVDLVKPEDVEDPRVEEIIEADFLVLRTSHYIPGKQRTVRGSLLLTPVQFIFDIVTRDPLDSLEPGDCCRLSGAGRAGQRLEVELSAESQEEITAFALVTDCPRWEVLIGQQYFTSIQGKRLWIEFG